jgi:hypothetical protein
MKLDRNFKSNGIGKYALLKLRNMSDKTPNLDVDAALRTLDEHGILDWGNTPETEFFVIRLKDKYAASGLHGYANAAYIDDPEYGEEVDKLARGSGPAHPNCKKPDYEIEHDPPSPPRPSRLRHRLRADASLEDCPADRCVSANWKGAGMVTHSSTDTTEALSAAASLISQKITKLDWSRDDCRRKGQAIYVSNLTEQIETWGRHLSTIKELLNTASLTTASGEAAAASVSLLLSEETLQQLARCPLTCDTTIPVEKWSVRDQAISLAREALSNLGSAQPVATTPQARELAECFDANELRGYSPIRNFTPQERRMIATALRGVCRASLTTASGEAATPGGMNTSNEELLYLADQERHSRGMLHPDDHSELRASAVREWALRGVAQAVTSPTRQTGDQ